MKLLLIQFVSFVCVISTPITLEEIIKIIKREYSGIERWLTPEKMQLLAMALATSKLPLTKWDILKILKEQGVETDHLLHELSRSRKRSAFRFFNSEERTPNEPSFLDRQQFLQFLHEIHFAEYAKAFSDAFHHRMAKLSKDERIFIKQAAVALEETNDARALKDVLRRLFQRFHSLGKLGKFEITEMFNSMPKLSQGMMEKVDALI